MPTDEARFNRSEVPDTALTEENWMAEPSSLAASMNVTRIHATIQAAEGGYTRDLFSLYRDVILIDSHIQSEFSKRLLAVVGDQMSILPYDKASEEDVEVATALNHQISACRSWRRAAIHLLNATLFPVSVVEKVYRATPSGYELRDLVPVPHHMLDFVSGRLRIYDVDSLGNVLGSSHDPDPNRYIIHRGHLLTTPDNWGGPFRSILFWWLLSSMDREWWARFMERYGTPFPVGKYRDQEGRTVLEKAFAMSTRLGGLVISEGTEVDLKQAAASDSASAYERFLSICQREKSKLIIGQTLSGEAQPTGLGSGTANLQEGVRQDIRKFDAAMLSETLRGDLFAQWVLINNQRGNAPRMAWGADSVDEQRATTSLLKSLSDAGLEVTDDAIPVLSERIGLSLQRRSSQPGSPFGTFMAMPPRIIRQA
jgi:phage gp29-like protein